ncbi:hypothetical protein FDF74_11605 [Clostridium niameyense]|uniref:Uncharacterized protein n=1 Tax=Clostridium niameyense TaxID=1622073 RepID=A0A6M0RDE0_9CLOT|nr:hypothetical protein [Clostridium niameyense]NEZ47827.1 hypothetical protein [Clostridium niameyense]
MNTVKYDSRPQVDTGYVDLINAIILRAVQDARLKQLRLNGGNISKDAIREKALNYLKSGEFEYMCECVGLDWAEIRRLTFMEVHNIERN